MLLFTTEKQRLEKEGKEITPGLIYLWCSNIHFDPEVSGSLSKKRSTQRHTGRRQKSLISGDDAFENKIL